MRSPPFSAANAGSSDDAGALAALREELGGERFVSAYLASRGEAPRTRPVVLVETASTNDDAKRAAAEGAPAGACFVADRQHAGRGRQGRRWHAEGGASLLVSIVLRPKLEPLSLPPLALVAGLAVIDAIEAQAPGLDVKLKWPNDVLASGRKLAGVLVEAALANGRVSWAVVGVGVNVRRGALPPELASTATSLEALGARGEGLERGALLGHLLARLVGRLGAFERGGFAALADEARARDGLLGRRVSGEQLRGVAAGIADDGRLLVRTPEGLEVPVSAGEIRIIDENESAAPG
ncbi:MAG: biotin--[acetyl-CoA-carboxylase] ligase [Polyangiaceae bacterium]|nr:biotin--[acetyl-CoA-carboxylase] ligase [Polyangiaceae bacterium]